jgi:2-polyprenyl-6-methoxyphenol hydroxylase-like FAD-dependent oxidoreductase
VNGSPTLETDVAIVGAGPVGLTLAMSLARRGVAVTVLERRKRGAPAPVKANHIAARTMEIFRTLGVADAIRKCGPPDDYPRDNAFRTTTTGIEFARTYLLAPRDHEVATICPDTAWPCSEPAHRGNQIYFEPVLYDFAAGLPGIRILDEVEVEHVSHEGDSAFVVGTNRGTGEPVQVASRYVVGCDGPRSLVRRAMSSELEGDAEVGRFQATLIEAPDLMEHMQYGPALMIFSMNPRRCGLIIAVDGRDRWMVVNRLLRDEGSFDAVDREWAIRTILGVDETYPFEIISHEDYVGRRLVANRFRNGRAFICGDAAHIWVPAGGYGMNAGIAAAEHLAWLLHGDLAGWGGPALLEAYQVERQPITEQVSRLALSMIGEQADLTARVPAEIEDDTPAGKLARATFGRAAVEISKRGHYAGGLNFGYFYADSPIIAFDEDAEPPSYDMHHFTESTVPGCRLPHLWMRDGRSLYDVHGSGYALVRLDPTIDVTSLTAAADQRRVPLTVIDVEPESVRDVYDHPLVLSRPDRHIAWRGHQAPHDPTALVELIRGAAPTDR